MLENKEQCRKEMHQLFKNLHFYAGRGYVNPKQWKQAQKEVYEQMDKLVKEWASALE